MFTRIFRWLELIGLDCSLCHSTSPRPPTDCYGCHADDYDRTTDPRHATAGFPTTCETCHLPTHIAWSQAIFEHDFPIDSGAHQVLLCSDCHRTANYRIFSCIDCHEHRQSSMDEKHREVGGYAYNSLACYSCHPQGRH